MPFTPLCHTTVIRSSIPLQPLGIILKSSFPIAFWFALKVALSVPTKSKLPSFKRLIKSCFVSGSSRNGGDITCPAA